MIRFTAASAIVVLGLSAGTGLAQPAPKWPYQDPKQPIEFRVGDLLRHMTPQEKAGQLMQESPDHCPARRLDQLVATAQLGSLLSIPSDPAARNRWQRLAVEQTRLGIPLMFGFDVIHGYRTVFPIPLGLACAWEPGLYERASAVAAREAFADGIDWTFAPMVDLARDPRWGRIAEGFGEDPWLGARYAAACVRGFQGINPAAPGQVAACLKHYVGYGATEGGRDYNTTELSDFTLQNFYLPQYKAGVDAGALTVMSAFNCLNGVPASANRHTLTDILRNQLGFRGFVVSDWQSVEQVITHGYAADAGQAARFALHAGVDMEMISDTYTNLPQLAAHDRQMRADVDEAVRRILRVKVSLGLFEHPYVDETLAQKEFLKPGALALAREAAAKACVLLKNEGGLLPLAHDVQRLALIGPLGSERGELLGCWAGRGKAEDVTSLESALRAQLAPGATLQVVKGCDVITSPRADESAVSIGQGRMDDAVTAARAADVVVLALGEPRDWSGEENCRTDLGLTGHQQELFDKVAAVGKPMVVLLFSGRPLAVPAVYQRANAVIEVWHPGVQGGPALADVLLGTVAPAGRLTISIPRAVGQVPIYYNHLNTGRPTLGLYKDLPSDPQYPFGYGLTYTAFEYGAVRLNSSTLSKAGNLTATAWIKNTGTRAGDEVVQLYLRDLAFSVGARPVRELKGFEKIHLAPGESRDVSFSLHPEDLGYYDPQGHWVVEPGRFELWIAPHARAGSPAPFTLK